ncbi:hypothetical protein D9613_012170 [Agrocybe pediades]|uniref:Uncharacterized protein n=1 Tax=Agrocybe pediades TaxID=84607 RepID=A0A8H4VVE2_9AGAR|nr:hypothetical protein D9613_012170 [Agrocybe pediades]
MVSHRSIVEGKGGWKTLHVREDVTLHLEQRNGALASAPSYSRLATCIERDGSIEGRSRSWAWESIEMVRVWGGEHWMTCERRAVLTFFPKQLPSRSLHLSKPQRTSAFGNVPTIAAYQKRVALAGTERKGPASTIGLDLQATTNPVASEGR